MMLTLVSISAVKLPEEWGDDGCQVWFELVLAQMHSHGTQELKHTCPL